MRFACVCVRLLRQHCGGFAGKPNAAVCLVDEDNNGWREKPRCSRAEQECPRGPAMLPRMLADSVQQRDADLVLMQRRVQVPQSRRARSPLRVRDSDCERGCHIHGVASSEGVQEWPKGEERRRRNAWSASQRIIEVESHTREAAVTIHVPKIDKATRIACISQRMSPWGSKTTAAGRRAGSSPNWQRAFGHCLGWPWRQ